MSKMSTTLTEVAQPMVQAIINHPFLQEIANGTISKDALIAYVQQDEYYLGEFAKYFANAFMLAANDEQQMVIAANMTTNSEVIAHEWLLEYAGTNLATDGVASPYPNTIAYINHIKTSGQHSYIRQITAVLPCLWIYEKFGKALAPKMDITSLLGKWMHVYANDLPEIFEMNLATDLFAILDKYTIDISDTERAELTTIFLRGCEYEYNFFDAAYTQKDWQYKGLK